MKKDFGGAPVLLLVWAVVLGDLAGLAGCTSKSPAQPDPVELASARGARRDSSGVRRVILDAEGPSILRSSSLAPLEVSFTSTAGVPIRLPTAKRERRQGRDLLWLDLKGVDPGDGELSFGGQRFPVTIARTISGWPEVTALPSADTERGPAIERALMTAAGPLRLSLLVEQARVAQRSLAPEVAVQRWLALQAEAENMQEPAMAAYGLRSAAFVELTSLRAFREADGHHDRADAIHAEHDLLVGRLRTRFQRAIAAAERGLLRDAEQMLRETYVEAWSWGFDREASFAMKSLGPLLQDQGRHREALAALEAAAPLFAGAKEADRTWYEADLAWVLLRGGIEKAFPLDSARIERMERSALASAERLSLREDQASILANLAWLARVNGDGARARELAAAAAAAEPSPRGFSRLFLLLLDGGLALDADQLDAAAAAFSSAERMALEEAPGGTSDALWQALRGAAAVVRRRAEPERAGALYLRAVAALERSALAAGFESGTATYLGDRGELAAEAEAFFAQAGATERAFEVSSRFRHVLYRVLGAASADLGSLRKAYEAARKREGELKAALELAPKDRRAGLEAELEAVRRDAREVVDRRIALSQQALDTKVPSVRELRSALAPDEVLLDLASDAQGVRAFALDRQGVRLARAETATQAASGLLQPGYRHAYVIAGNAEGSLALPVALIDRVSVSFLPEPSALLGDRKMPDGPPLIIGDPSSNLPEARLEARALAAGQAGSTLLLGDDADRARILSAIGGRRVFHFAGHGKLEGAWDAELVLARGEVLRVSDVLAAKPQLGLVVLSGCDTGAASALSRTHAISLPEVFFAAGATGVVAANGKVGDREARAFIEELYRQGAAESPVAGYQRAVAQQIQRGETGWRSFRVVGRR